MLVIEDNTTGKIRKYATNDSELIDSLFNDGEGTLDTLYKIEKRKNAILFWTDEERGVYIWTPNGLWGKFKKMENKKLFAQHTLDKITLTENF